MSPAENAPRASATGSRVMRRLGRAWSGGLALAILATLSLASAAAAAPYPDRRAVPLLVSQSGRLRKYGTGVVVAPNTIVTAEHVLARNIRVLLPQGQVRGQRACRTGYEGLAVVKARLPRGTPVFRLSVRPPAVGESVTVPGYPLRRWRVATGRITHLIRSANLSGRVVRAQMFVFRPALDHGASGSPVLDGRGQVIGIAVASNRQSNYSIAFPTGAGLRLCSRFLRESPPG